MRITTRAVYDIESGCLLEWHGYHSSGPVAECKRDTAKGQATNLINFGQGGATQATDMQKMLQSIALPMLQQVLGMQSGFMPGQKEAMTSQAIQGTNQNFNTAEQAVRSQMGARGLAGGAGGPASGIYAGGLGAMESQRGQALSGNLANINIQDAMQRLQNIWNSSNILGNFANTWNPAPFTGLAGSAMGSLGNLWTAPSVGSQLATSWLSPKMPPPGAD